MLENTQHLNMQEEDFYGLALPLNKMYGDMGRISRRREPYSISDNPDG